MNTLDRWIVSGVLVVGGATILYMFETSHMAANLGFYYEGSKAQARDSQCKSNLNHLGRAWGVYSADHDGFGPGGELPFAAVEGYLKLHGTEGCPVVHASGKLGYAANADLRGVKLTSLSDPAATPLAYDAVLERSGQWERIPSLPTPGRHHDGNHVLYADLTVRPIR